SQKTSALTILVLAGIAISGTWAALAHRANRFLKVVDDTGAELEARGDWPPGMPKLVSLSRDLRPKIAGPARLRPKDVMVGLPIGFIVVNVVLLIISLGSRQ